MLHEIEDSLQEFVLPQSWQWNHLRNTKKDVAYGFTTLLVTGRGSLLFWKHPDVLNGEHEITHSHFFHRYNYWMKWFIYISRNQTSCLVSFAASKITYCLIITTFGPKFTFFNSDLTALLHCYSQLILPWLHGIVKRYPRTLTVVVGHLGTFHILWFWTYYSFVVVFCCILYNMEIGIFGGSVYLCTNFARNLLWVIFQKKKKKCCWKPLRADVH